MKDIDVMYYVVDVLEESQAVNVDALFRKCGDMAQAEKVFNQLLSANIGLVLNGWCINKKRGYTYKYIRAEIKKHFGWKAKVRKWCQEHRRLLWTSLIAPAVLLFLKESVSNVLSLLHFS